MGNKIDFQLNKRITLQTVRCWMQTIAENEGVKLVFLKPDEGDGGYNYAICGDNEIWMAPFKRGKVGDKFGKYTLMRDCDNPVECMLISLFHEIGHLKLLRNIPHHIPGFKWNDTSDYQYELWISMLGIDYAFTKYGIRFSDQAVKWLLHENETYMDDHVTEVPLNLTVNKPNSNSYEVSGVRVGHFGESVKGENPVSNPSAMRKSLMEIQEYAAAMTSDEDEANAFAILDEARKGLETPARNCDRPFKTLAEFQRYYIEHGCKKGLGMVTDGEITKVPWKSQFEKWMLEPLS